MGKRELLLFLGFLLFGGVVYQVTAPPKEEGKEGFSFSKFVDKVQAEIKGERVETQVQRTASADAPSGEGRLVIPEYRGTLTILGEDHRHDLTAELKAIVYGMDEDQSKMRAKDMNVGFEENGDDVQLKLDMPDNVNRRPQLDLTIRVPTHLALKLQLRGGQADLRKLRDVLLENSRGKITMADVGDAGGEFENGAIEIVHARGVKLETRRAEVRLEEIAGELTLDAEHGELRLQQIHGPAKITMKRLDCEIDGIHGPMQIEPERANLSVRNIAAPLIVRGENTEVRATMTSAVAVTIETTDDKIDLRVPDAGITIDAKTDGGQIRVAGAHDSETDESDQPEPPEKPQPPEKPKGEHPEPVERREPKEPQERPEPPEPPAPPAPGKPRPPLERLDRMQRRGEMRTEKREDGESHVQHTSIKLHGGGPTVTLRNTRGDIVIR